MDWDLAYKLALILISFIPGLFGIIMFCIIAGGAQKEMEEEERNDKSSP